MRSSPCLLVNGATLDLVPSRVMQARTIHVLRLLRTSDWVLRRKSDGRFFAVVRSAGNHMRWRWLVRSEVSARRVEAEMLARQARSSAQTFAHLPRYSAMDVFDREIDASYAQRTGLKRIAEPPVLAFGGFDRYHRPLWLEASAAQAWNSLRAAALRDDVVLEAISGFRSRAYQVGIFRRKQARGQSMEEILAVNAAPGFSEHHSGRALDVGTPGEPPAEESFELTPAFAWLAENAARFCFVMSYPRDNPHAITYEPWHWMWRSTR